MKETAIHKEKNISPHTWFRFIQQEIYQFLMGESIVYSDKLELAYFIPVLFFRTVDHYIDRDSSNTGDNAQLFFNAVYKNTNLKTKLYTTLFIDELSITNFLKGTNLSAIGVTAGVNFVDPILENSDLSIRIYSIKSICLYELK
ncbi:MAG: hypothetical protein MZV64_29190 [Ignavibacteriales bacterium]|nr:hypothetical protein [Ignavibacteriales bacterium]